MEKEPVSMDLNSECLELPPLNDLKEIISEFEKSGVANEPLIFQSPSVVQTDLENKSEENVSVLSDELKRKDNLIGKDKSSFGLLLDEKELSVIDFEIAKDIFDDIKIKEEIIGFEEPVSCHLTNHEQGNDLILDSVLMAGKNSNLDEQIQQTEVQRIKGLEKNVEVFFSAESGMEAEDNAIITDLCSNSEIKKIMAELQDESLIHRDNSNRHLSSNSSNLISNICSNINGDDLKNSVVNETRNDEKLNEIICPAEENIKSPFSILQSVVAGDNMEIKIETDSNEKTDKSGNSPNNETANSNDSIFNTIESVIQASIPLCDAEADLHEKNNSPNQIMTTSNKKRNSIKLNFSEKNNDDRKEIPIKKKTHGLFEVVVPLIGTNVMKAGNDKPFTHRYDLARQRNELRAKFQKTDHDFPVSNISYQEWRKQRESRTKDEIEKEEKDKTIDAIKLATAFTKIAMKILQEYDKDEPNEEAMIKCFGYFECAPVSPLSLLYAPHFVHTMMLIRADADLSPKLRKAANSSYYKCHALFPIPEGYNFETVFTSEVKKNIPDEFNNLSDIELNYGDYNSSDFEDDTSDYSEDSDKEWGN